jgi:hypothetical protein
MALMAAEQNLCEHEKPCQKPQPQGNRRIFRRPARPGEASFDRNIAKYVWFMTKLDRHFLPDMAHFNVGHHYQGGGWPKAVAI